MPVPESLATTPIPLSDDLVAAADRYVGEYAVAEGLGQMSDELAGRVSLALATGFDYAARVVVCGRGACTGPGDHDHVLPDGRVIPGWLTPDDDTGEAP